jgi:hypothetical protein
MRGSTDCKSSRCSNGLAAARGADDGEVTITRRDGAAVHAEANAVFRWRVAQSLLDLLNGAQRTPSPVAERNLGSRPGEIEKARTPPR